MYMYKRNIGDIKSNNMAVPEVGTYVTDSMTATVSFERDTVDGTVNLSIDTEWFDKSDIKELRKLLKILEAELK